MICMYVMVAHVFLYHGLQQNSISFSVQKYDSTSTYLELYIESSTYLPFYLLPQNPFSYCHTKPIPLTPNTA